MDLIAFNNDPNLIAYYPFIGGNANDYGSYNKQAILTNTGFAQDNLHYSALFAGNGRINIGAYDLIPTTAGQPISISLWFKSTVPQSSSLMQTINMRDGFGFSYSHSSSTYKGAAFFQNSLGTFYSTGNKAFSQNVWYHIVIIYDGTYLKLFVNGSPAGTNSNIGSTARKGQFKNLVGAGGVSDTNYFTGYISDVRIYSKALSPAEIAALYNFTVKSNLKKYAMPPPPPTGGNPFFALMMEFMEL